MSPTLTGCHSSPGNSLAFKAKAPSWRNCADLRGVETDIMAMVLGKKRTAMGDMNVTPLIDVLLVLLIIFMVITPSRTVGLEAAVPQPSSDKRSSSPESDAAIVIQIDRNLAVTINSESTDMEQLGRRLAEIFKFRANRLVFVKADRDVEFQHVAKAIDKARGAGINKIALLGDRLR